MIPRLRRFAVISLLALCLGCRADSDPTSTDSVSTTSSNTVTTTATTTTTTSALSGSTSSSTVSSIASSAAASSASTNSTGGATTSASTATSASTTTSAEVGGAAGTPNTSTGGGGTSGGDDGTFVIRDTCSHEACGGNLANSTWRYVRACVTADQIVGPIQSFCSSVTLVGSSGELTGTITFDDTGFNQDVSFSLTMELDVPAECNISCPSFAATMAVMGFPETTCEESNGGCHCVGTAHGTDPRSGEYTTDDTTVTLMGLGDVDARYCAGADSFSYAPPVMLVPQGTPMDVVYETVPQ